MDVTDASAEFKRAKSSTGSGAFMQTAPMVAEMARERRPIRQGAACAYAESLTEEQRTDFAGCYVWRCERGAARTNVPSPTRDTTKPRGVPPDSIRSAGRRRRPSLTPRPPPPPKTKPTSASPPRSRPSSLPGGNATRCGKAGIPVSCSYNFGLGGSKYLCWSVNTIPFGCFAMPLEYEQGARYVSLKRDAVVMVVDDERRTLACYPGVGVEKTQCCLCEKIA